MPMRTRDFDLRHSRSGGDVSRPRYINRAAGLDLPDWDQAIQRGSMDPFSFTPNENDPELMLLRSGAQRQAQERRGRNLNELNRAGLLGTSASFGVMQEDESDLARLFEDISSGVHGRRRGEALGLYEGELGFRRGLETQRLGGRQEQELMRLRARLEREMQGQQGLFGALSQLGGLGASFLPGGQFLRLPRAQPRRSLDPGYGGVY